MSPKPKQNEISCNGFNYKVSHDDKTEIFQLTHNSGNPPETLCKYYSLKNHNIEAITTPYLFATHPADFNDKMDCDQNLISYHDEPLAFFKDRLCKENPDYGGPVKSIQWVEEMYEKDKGFLCNLVAELMYKVIFKRLGLISLTNNPENVLMWSYYCENKGFVVRFKVDRLIESLNADSKKLEFLGLHPINYVEKLEKISFSKYNFGLCYHYATNIKHNFWRPEQEWRITVHNPFGNYHPYHNCSDIDSRKCKYEINCIDDIILGYGFFHTLELDYEDRRPDYDIFTLTDNKTTGTDKTLRKKLLDFIIEDNIACKHILKDISEFTLKPYPVKVEKLDEFRYKVIKLYV